MVAMMLVVNYAEKDKNGTSSAQTASLARLDLATAQRSAAAQQTAGGAARVDRACLCDAQQAHVLLLRWRCLPSLLVVQQRVERGCAPATRRISDPKAARSAVRLPQRESAGTRAEWQPPALAWLMAGHSLALSICVLVTQAVRESAAEWQWPLRLFDPPITPEAHRSAALSAGNRQHWYGAPVCHACAAAVSRSCSLTSHAVRCAALHQLSLFLFPSPLAMSAPPPFVHTAQRSAERAMRSSAEKRCAACSSP